MTALGLLEGWAGLQCGWLQGPGMTVAGTLVCRAGRPVWGHLEGLPMLAKASHKVWWGKGSCLIGVPVPAEFAFWV